MEIIYHPEHIFGYLAEDEESWIIEFEDGDRHIEIRLDDKKMVEDFIKQLKSNLEDKNGNTNE